MEEGRTFTLASPGGVTVKDVVKVIPLLTAVIVTV
jgi:hypothetical protein